ncbi:MAG: hypothetical protein HOY78_15230 [Saccharothrix sp.]|nr:hypothetical protein [Saccharothrix sp.]
MTRRPDQTTPHPAMAALLWAADAVAVERLPRWAAEWLVDGFDSDALRTLAGLDASDQTEIRELLPDVFAELSVPVPAAETAVVELSLTRVAELVLDDRAGELWAVQKVEELLEFTPVPPVGPLVAARALRPDDPAFAAKVRAACVSQLRRYDPR